MNRYWVFFLASVILALAYVPELLAQGDDWYVSASNYGRYYYYEDTKSDSAADRFQFDIYMGQFYAGGWYEMKHVFVRDTLSSLKVTSNKLTRRYFGWEDDGLNIQVGNFYQVFDRGLILNTYREDETSTDLVLDGIKINWRKKYFDLDVISTIQGIGDSVFYMLGDPVAGNILRGARVKFKPLNQFHIGGAYLSYIENMPNRISFIPKQMRSNLDQINARVNLDYMDAYVEYARRKSNLDDPTRILSKGGDGTYVNITAFYSYFTGMFEYKNYKNLTCPILTTASDNIILNMPPAVNRQDRLIQSEGLHQLPLNYITGERGYRGNLSISWSDYWGFEFDYAKSYSRDSISYYIYEYYAGVRGNYFEDNTFSASLDFFEFTKKDETKSEFEINYFFSDIHLIELHTHMIDYEPIDSSSYSEKFIDITYSKAQDFHLTIGGSLSDNENSDDSKRLTYMEFTYTFGNGNHDLVLFRGGQRGGLVCAGGACKVVPSFEGFRVSLLSRF
ncbi:MAG: hypothetical protein J7K40_14550 [candidate division Zixibacteria bacterium]|nr:hypothetical protein [candidate division Zixibacteria bacterium]